ncbi:hypothetical protein HDU88_004754 [Geranomyces variabilis]|nr:hypothetical protein HDU88_004754 [Geranomyces variabilis]
MATVMPFALLSVARQHSMSGNEIPPFSASPVLTADERTLAAIWARVLDLPFEEVVMCPSVSFPALGAKSMAVMRMVGAAKREGFAFSARDVYANATLANLASRRS